MKTCDACGNQQAYIGIGGAIICRDCELQIRAEMDALRSAGKPVNVLHIAKRMYRAANPVGGYLLRDIPEELWQRAKHRAVDDKVSLRDLVIAALRAYLGER